MKTSFQSSRFCCHALPACRGWRAPVWRRARPGRRGAGGAGRCARLRLPPQGVPFENAAPQGVRPPRERPPRERPPRERPQGVRTQAVPSRCGQPQAGRAPRQLRACRDVILQRECAKTQPERAPRQLRAAWRRDACAATVLCGGLREAAAGLVGPKKPSLCAGHGRPRGLRRVTFWALPRCGPSWGFA
jgi:hypothetical protein